MKKFMLGMFIVAFVVAALCVGGAKNAAALTLSIDDLNDAAAATVTTDQVFVAPVDGSLIDGVVNFSGPVSANWAINISTGISAPIIGDVENPNLDLNSVNVNLTGAGDLRLILEDTYNNVANLNSSITGFSTLIGGTTDGTVDVTFNINGTSLAMGGFGPGAFSYSNSLDGLGTNNITDFFLSITVDIHHTSAAQITSFDAKIQPVPEPGTIALLGIGLAGLAGVSLRRRAKKKAV